MLRVALLLAAVLLAAASPGTGSFRFVILGDRTGETQPGVYEQVLKAASAENPAFILSVGDTIQGLDDTRTEEEWLRVGGILKPYRRFPLYLAPGNHDIWSDESERLFRKYSGHPAHYGFDYGTAHFTVLDNSRSEEFSPGELAFLEKDLSAHTAAKWKFIVSHRPSWIFNVLLRNSEFPLHKIARKYGVQYILAGHVHQMLHFRLDGIDYASMPSAGGHLRASRQYADGWFFGYTTVDIGETGAAVRVHETGGRVTLLNQWGAAGLIASP